MFGDERAGTSLSLGGTESGLSFDRYGNTSPHGDVFNPLHIVKGATVSGGVDGASRRFTSPPRLWDRMSIESFAIYHIHLPATFVMVGKHLSHCV